MWKRTKQDERKQLREIMLSTKQEVDYGDNMRQDIVPVNNRSLKKVKKKREQIQRNLNTVTVEREPSSVGIWLKMWLGSSFAILAILAVPVSVVLLILLATVPEVIRDLDTLPSTVITVSIGLLLLFFIQSALISSLLVFALRLKKAFIGTIITGIISLVSIMLLLNFFLPIFDNRFYYG